MTVHFPSYEFPERSPVGQTSIVSEIPPPHPPPPPEETGADLVVTEKFVDIPPIVRVTCFNVLYDADDITRTFTVSPFDIVPAEPVYARLLIEYNHPDILIIAGIFIPVRVTLLESILVDISTPVCGVNAKVSGVPSFGSPKAKYEK